MKLKLPFLASLCLLSFTPLTSAEVVTLESKSGKKMIVTLLSRQGDKVVIRRSPDNKEFAISPDTLSAASKTMLMGKMDKLKVAYPPLSSTVSISKRRSPDGNSSYMKKMEIAAKVTITNKDYKIPCPTCTINVIFIGQDQRYPDQFAVLSNQKFNIDPSPKGTTIKTEPFITTYDSDNKGEGNIGGDKYVGYLVVLNDHEGKVIHTKTVYPGLKKALDIDSAAAELIKTYPKGTKLAKNMKKPGANEKKSNEVK